MVRNFVSLQNMRNQHELLCILTWVHAANLNNIFELLDLEFEYFMCVYLAGRAFQVKP